MTGALAAHHHHAAAGWLTDGAMRRVIYSAIGRVMRSLPLAEALVVAGICIVGYRAWRKA